MRFRHTDSDLYRLARQQLFVKAVKQRLPHFSPLDLPRLVKVITTNVEVGHIGEFSARTILGYALFAYDLPGGHFFQSRIDVGCFQGYNELTVSESCVQDAVRDFVRPDVEAPEKATAVALNRKLATKGPAPRNTTVMVLNGNGRPGAAATANQQLDSLGYKMVYSTTGDANAPSYQYYDTQVYYEGTPDALAAARRLSKLFPTTRVEPLPPEIAPLANGAIVTVVVGQTYHGQIATAPADRTPTRQPPRVSRDGTSAGVLKPLVRRVPFTLYTPTVLATGTAARDADARPPLPTRGPQGGAAHVLERRRRLLWDSADRLAGCARPRGPERGNDDQGSSVPPLLLGPNASHGRRRGADTNVLGDQHAARQALERDDALDCAKPAAHAASLTFRPVVRIGIFGAGYVGLVTGACLAELGHEVVVRDVVAEKVDRLRAGDVPIFEPGLAELLEKNIERIEFTLDVAEAVEGAEFVFVCVDTPPLYSGDADLRVWTVIDELPRVGGAPVLVMKSTVPVGTGEKVRSALDQRGLTQVGYVSNPVHTEGRGGGTSCRRTGSSSAPSKRRTATASRRCTRIDAPVVRADVNSAEMIKLASNAFLSTRISFVNEIANVCELVGADVQKVAEGMGLDHRLGKYFLRAGDRLRRELFPEGRVALKQLAGNSGYHFQLLSAVIEVNELQKRRVISKLQRHLGRLRGKQIALLGLAFKAGTDDMREAPSLVLASRLIAEGRRCARGIQLQMDTACCPRRRSARPSRTPCATPMPR